ncbi:unnamed protein product [Caenorhabditis auriculariae]|uniref:fumarate reductase (NADH) n=1 Tax=Caenorhabditis auriculariae TaxID=2777116 RepID=A0A8S1H231_9PELO|nr:unnamed protein product [Caenorhabditis auriculariae]
MRIFVFLALISTADAARKRGPPQVSEPVVVVGGGLAGLSAALEVLDSGSKVVLIESQANTGGNSAKASSGINACATAAQKKLKIRDSFDLFYSDTLNAGDRQNDVELVDVLVHSSTDAIKFLEESGVDLGDVNLCGGHSTPRTHWVPSPKEGKPIPVGFEIMKKLRARLDAIQIDRPEDVTILNGTSMTGLVSWNEYMTGVNVLLPSGKSQEVAGKAVILATGGFASDKSDDSLLIEFAPETIKFPTTNGAFAKGDGVKMARAMGAAVVGMENVQIHPTAFVDPADPKANTKFLAAEALRGKGAIMINMDGKRFANELGRRDYLSARITKGCKPIDEFQGGSGGHSAAIMLMNDEAADSFGRPAFNFYHLVKKFFKKYDNLAAFAKAANIDEKTIETTINEYNELVGSDDKNVHDDFSKTVFPVNFVADQPIYAAIVTPAIHYTMGGLKIDSQGRVFNDLRKEPFKGLFAAGEVAGGVHGSNRLAGNSLLECVVFGRIAGKNAARTKYDKTEL